MNTYEWSDKLDSLNQTHSFLIHQLIEAYKREDHAQALEYETKLQKVDDEINRLLK